MVTEQGYKRRTFEDIINAKVTKARELFGDSINTDENTALGKFIMICAYDQYHVEELAEKIYYSIFPQTAFGMSLDRLAWSMGITRKPATPASYKVKVTGTAGATIEAGFLVGVDPVYVGDETELTFENTASTIIGENGECEITVTCTMDGSIGNVSPSIINRIVNPVAYAEAVQGIEVIEAATDDESDHELRKRYEIAREGKGGCTPTAIISALVKIPTVNNAFVDVNESATETSENGLPPKTITCYVDGGEAYKQEIGQTIFDNKPVGIGTYGAESVSVSYGALSDYVVYFSYVETVSVYIKLEITTNEKFEAKGNETIKENIEAFIKALEMGEPLITTALYGEIYKVKGVVMALIETSTDGINFSADNISVDANKRCVLNALTINGETV